MELLQDPDIKQTYDRCKYKVKVWEHKFKKKNGRIPSRLDIKDADREIRTAYKTYFNLKSAALEQSFMDIDGFNSDEESPAIQQSTTEEELSSTLALNVSADSSQIDLACNSNLENTNTQNTWGDHLNSTADEIKGTDKELSKPKVGASLSQKLFCGSKFSKRNPRKSMSFNKRNESKVPDFLSQPTMSSSLQLLESGDHSNNEVNFSLSSFNNVKIKPAEKIIQSTSLNLVQNALDNRIVTTRTNIDSGWINRITNSDNKAAKKVGYDFDNEDIIDDSDDEDDRNFICKKTRLNSFITTPQTVVNINKPVESRKLDFSNIFPHSEKNQLTQPVVIETNFVDNRELVNNSVVTMETTLNDNTVLSNHVVAMDTTFNDNKQMTISDDITVNINVNNLIADSNSNKPFGVIEKTLLESNILEQSIETDFNNIESDSEEPSIVVQEKSNNSVVRKKTVDTFKFDHTMFGKSSRSSFDFKVSPSKVRKSGRASKKRFNEVGNSDEEGEQSDPFHSDNDSNDPEYDVMKDDCDERIEGEGEIALKSKDKTVIRESKELKEPKEPREPKEPKEPKERKEPKVKIPKEAKLKTPKIPREPKAKTSKIRTPREPRGKILKPTLNREVKPRIPRKSTTTKSSKPDNTVTPKDPLPITGENTVENNVENNEEEYVLEFSVKPRFKTVPRDLNIKRTLAKRKQEARKLDSTKTDVSPTTTTKTVKTVKTADGGVVKDKRTQALEKLANKIASGTLNDNYVTVNLKKKVFVRGKKTMTFSKFKKQAWKNKKKSLALCGPDMDMGGCDGGMLTCFTCGQIGHFARDCKAAGNDKLLPLSQLSAEEPCPYPTLDEAAQLAQGSVLAVRKTNRVTSVKSSEQQSDDNSQQSVNSSQQSVNNSQQSVNSSQQSGDNSEQQSGVNNSESESDSDMFGDDDDELLAETLLIEESLAKVDMHQYVDKTESVNALYRVKEDGSLIDTPPEVFEALRLFGHTTFRAGQERAVMRILSGLSTLVTLSTGSGKSLCYQLPAYLYAQRAINSATNSMSKSNSDTVQRVLSPSTVVRCISLVISPLVSLMEDQVTGVPSFLRAACLHTNKTSTQRDKIMAAIAAGELDVLLLSPEAVVAGEKSTGFGSLLRHLPPISFACIDEAHCLSQWSHNFRPSYLMLSRILRERLGITTILGLTATATLATRDSIVRHLCIPDGRAGIISDIPLPSNLRLTVSREEGGLGVRDRALLDMMVKRWGEWSSVIVYCTRREDCERVAGYLRTGLGNIVKEKDFKEGLNKDVVEPAKVSKKRKRRVELHAEPYHAGLPASRRRTIQKAFMSGELRIVVATVAFGMGINKSDIRSVIHYNMPKNFESYVQEVGRAGRDGLPAHCHLFMDNKGHDRYELQRHIHSNSLDRHVIRKLLQRVFVPCGCLPNACPRHEVAFSIAETVRALDVPEENLATLLCYLELHERRYVEMLSVAYVHCKVISYAGPNALRKAAKECAPLAMAMVMYPRGGGKEDNVLEFPVVDVAAAIGWDSGIVKHKLKNLEWFIEHGQSKRSPLTVQLSNLGFRLLAPGNLTGDELDEALDNLYSRVTSQEETAMQQLQALYQALVATAEPSYRVCLASDVTPREDQLKTTIRHYFDSDEPGSTLSFPVTAPKVSPLTDEARVTSDTRALVHMYRDNTFTGRAVARIFHGIQSPNYPAVIWGRCKFWRAHLYEDFNGICRVATAEILNMR